MDHKKMKLLYWSILATIALSPIYLLKHFSEYESAAFYLSACVVLAIIGNAAYNKGNEK